MGGEDTTRIIVAVSHDGSRRDIQMVAAVRPGRYGDFRAACKAGKIDPFQFDAYGEVVQRFVAPWPSEGQELDVTEMYVLPAEEAAKLTATDGEADYSRVDCLYTRCFLK